MSANVRMASQEDSIVFYMMVRDYCLTIHNAGERMFNLSRFAKTFGYSVVGTEIKEFKMTMDFIANERICFAFLEKVFTDPIIH
jgi:hypothetical protein